MGESRKFHTAEGLSKKFDAVSTKWGKLSAVVEAANNFLGMFDAQTDEDVKRLLVNAATNPGSVTSIMATSYTPNFDPVEEKKKEEEARDALLEMLKEQIRQSNERISKMIDKCFEMAEWCRKQAEKAAEAMDKIATRMAKNSQFINDVDELFDNYKATGHFDKEKARRMLLERGVKTDEKISDAKLLELLKTQKDDALGDIVRDTKNYEELEKQKKKFEESAEEIERLARELKQRRDEIDKLENPEEQAQRLKELEEEYSLQVRIKAKKLEEDAEKLEKLSLDNETKFTNSSGVTPDAEKKQVSSFMAGFTSSANPAEKQIKPDESNLGDSVPMKERSSQNPLPKSSA